MSEYTRMCDFIVDALTENYKVALFHSGPGSGFMIGFLKTLDKESISVEKYNEYLEKIYNCFEELFREKWHSFDEMYDLFPNFRERFGKTYLDFLKGCGTNTVLEQINDYSDKYKNYISNDYCEIIEEFFNSSISSNDSDYARIYRFVHNPNVTFLTPKNRSKALKFNRC